MDGLAAGGDKIQACLLFFLNGQPSGRSGFLCDSIVCLAGCKAKPPSRIEAKTIDCTKHHVTVHGKKDTNPVAASAENIAEGRQMSGTYCMVCHELEGHNTGVLFALTISPPVPSLASGEVQVYTDRQIKWIIENGRYPSGMPPSKGDFSTEEMWQMVIYIGNLPKADSLGDPPVIAAAASKDKVAPAIFGHSYRTGKRKIT